MRFQPVKYNIMQITKKRIKKINASFYLEGIVLDNVEYNKYIVIKITKDLKWSTHVSNVSAVTVPSLDAFKSCVGAGLDLKF